MKVLLCSERDNIGETKLHGIYIFLISFIMLAHIYIPHSFILHIKDTLI